MDSGVQDEHRPQDEQSIGKSLEEVAARLHIVAEVKGNERAAGQSHFATGEGYAPDKPAGDPEIAKRHRQQPPPSELKQERVTGFRAYPVAASECKDVTATG
jgi:hypothetical protein